MTALLAAAWIALAPLQVARQELAVAAANGKVYAIGGISGLSVTATVEEYDPAANTWRFVAPLPETLHHSAAAVVDDVIYVIGGYRTLNFDATSVVYRYDSRSDVWSRASSLPSPRGAAAAATIDGRIYLAGGAPGGDALTVYDPIADRWTTLMPMPTAREHLAAAAVGGKLYVIGGRSSGNVGAMEIYDPSFDRWTSLPPLPTPRSGIAAAAIDGRIYVFGGEGNPNATTGVFAETEVFDAAHLTWTADTPMAVPRHGIGAAVINGRIYIPGGAVIQGFGAVNAHDVLVVAPPPRRRVVRPSSALRAPSPRSAGRRITRESPRPAKRGEGGAKRRVRGPALRLDDHLRIQRPAIDRDRVRHVHDLFDLHRFYPHVRAFVIDVFDRRSLRIVDRQSPVAVRDEEVRGISALDVQRFLRRMR